MKIFNSLIIALFLAVPVFGQTDTLCICSAKGESPWAFVPDIIIGGSKAQLNKSKYLVGGDRFLIKYLWHVMRVDNSDTLNFLELSSYATGGDELYTSSAMASVYFNGAYEWMLERFGVPIIIGNPEFDFNFHTLLKDNTLPETVKKRLCYAYAWRICGGFSSLLWVESFPAYGDTPASYRTRLVTGRSLEAILNLYQFKATPESL